MGRNHERRPRPGPRVGVGSPADTERRALSGQPKARSTTPERTTGHHLPFVRIAHRLNKLNRVDAPKARQSSNPAMTSPAPSPTPTLHHPVPNLSSHPRAPSYVLSFTRNSDKPLVPLPPASAFIGKSVVRGWLGGDWVGWSVRRREGCEWVGLLRVRGAPRTLDRTESATVSRAKIDTRSRLSDISLCLTGSTTSNVTCWLIWMRSKLLA